MEDYLPSSKKTQTVKNLINEALDILHQAGIPFSGKGSRALERIAMAFLAVSGVTGDWKMAKGMSKNRRLKTREIIGFINENFEENISSGSYDDIRRKDLKLPVVALLIINSGDKGRATNDPTRGYSLDAGFEKLIVSYKTKHWDENLKEFLNGRQTLTEILARKRNHDLIPVMLPGNKPIVLSLGDHNELQKAIVENFLPRFGHGCEVLYIGDTSNKSLHMELKVLHDLKFFELSHDELPDIIAFNKNKNWIYLIEAVHSSGPISEIRLHELKLLLKDCPAELVFVTAFLNRDTFRKWSSQIAWETEVWIASNPDHLIHFNGHKFLGPF
ncbi:MAG TPA: BsuBI/PstI family type II restriction endonuclease [Mucilaginibacter sp.]